MFSKAYQKATKYTRPVIVSRRQADGTVVSGAGTYIIVNADGWIITAAHILDTLTRFQKDAAEIADYEAQKLQIENDPKLNSKQKRKTISRLPKKSDWITNYSYFWSVPGIGVNAGIANVVADIAIARLEPFDPNSVQEYPVFRDMSRELLLGTSLCRLGFPFHEIKATFDDATKHFTLPNGTLPVPFFPNEGIHTRIAMITHSNGQTAKFIETSSPGLKGQSGGPIFDTDGVICGIQSRTAHLQLGFSPTRYNFNATF